VDASRPHRHDPISLWLMGMDWSREGPADPIIDANFSVNIEDLGSIQNSWSSMVSVSIVQNLFHVWDVDFGSLYFACR
jgi:hypothetical protein